MRNLFFYGVLRHLTLLKVVLGQSDADLDISDAQLPGYRNSSVAEGAFPMLVERAGSEVEGILLRGLGPQRRARMDFYMGSLGYELNKAVLADGSEVGVYVLPSRLWSPSGAWSLEGWVQNWGALNVIAATEVMSYFGTRSCDDVAAMYPMIRARAASNLRARDSRHSPDGFQGNIDVQSRNRAYARFFAMDDFVLRHAKFDGEMSDVLERGVLVGADASILLPYDPVRDRVLLVEQVRFGPLGRGDPSCWQLEPIAGRVDPGETPEQAARREAMEEAGIEIGMLETVAEVYPSPGTSTEFYYNFLGQADLPDETAGQGGLAAEDEDIRSHILSFDALMTRVANLQVANAPLALAAYYLAHHRERLRSEWTKDTPREY